MARSGGLWRTRADRQSLLKIGRSGLADETWTDQAADDKTRDHCGRARISAY